MSTGSKSTKLKKGTQLSNATPEQRAAYYEARAHYGRLMKPLIDDVVKSEILSARDFSITINAR
jgi:hypothetical protein